MTARDVRLSMKDPAFDAFAAFATAAYPEQPLTAAVREACLAYMSTDPLDAARSAARRAAWLFTYYQLNRLSLRLFGEMAEKAKQHAETALIELREVLAEHPDALGEPVR